MNLSDYRTEVKDRLGVPTADTSLSDATLDRALNGALKHIASQKPWPWLFTEDTVALAAGASGFYPPAHWSSTNYITQGGTELGLRSLRELISSSGASTGQPGYYAVKGDRILLAPVSDAAYTLLHGYSRAEPLLVLSTDAPLLPDAHSEWLIAEAGVRIAVRTNNVIRLGILREEAGIAKQAVLADVIRTGRLPHILRTKPSIWQDC